jgi:UDP-N-acetylenolpyruvoylglucosamine reductase
MHDGYGTYADMLNLISLAQDKVEEKFDIKLENEVQIITNT